jgi:hypothetical protein
MRDGKAVHFPTAHSVLQGTRESDSNTQKSERAQPVRKFPYHQERLEAGWVCCSTPREEVAQRFTSRIRALQP